MTWRFHNPVSLYFGNGALSALPSLTRGRRVALVAFREAADLGLVAHLRELLGSSLSHVIDRIEPNPDVATLAPLYREFWTSAGSVDLLVALGGGSAIDTAKALMVGTEGGTFAALLEALAAGAPFVPQRVKPLIAIPTTAGTGSEVTPWATVWDRLAGRKYSLHLAETWPEAAIVDPSLTVSLPAGATLAAGLDALSHALEAVWNVNANPVSDLYAVAAARSVLRTLPALMRDLTNDALREQMSLAAVQAGLAFSNTKTALAHSISYDMTLHHGLPHGIACSFTLPMVLARALGADAARDRVLAQIFDGRLADAPTALTRFLEALGVSTQFTSYGVTGDEATRIVTAALDGVRGRNFIGARSSSAGSKQS